MARAESIPYVARQFLAHRSKDAGIWGSQLPRSTVEDALRDGRLVEVLAAWPGTGMPVSTMYPHRRQLSPRVRVFVGWVGFGGR